MEATKENVSHSMQREGWPGNASIERLAALLGRVLELEGKVISRQILTIALTVTAVLALAFVVTVLTVVCIALTILALFPTLSPLTVSIILLAVSAAAGAVLLLALRRKVVQLNPTFPEFRTAFKESLVCLEPIFRR